MCKFYENYQRLAEAIIMQAVRDYRRCGSHQVQDSIENFFKSDWFTALCELDSEKLIKKLRQERTMKNG